MNKVDLLGWILASDYRKLILMQLDRYTLPKTIVDLTGLRFSHVSRALAEMAEKGLVILENPTAKKGRLYSLTDLGREVKKMIT